jgi:hypothetical protein
LTGDKELGRAAQRAIEFIEAAQDAQCGGWRYVPRQGGDTSVFGWQVAALQAARLAGLKVQPATLDGARKWLKSVAVGEHGGKFSYTPGGGPTPSMTAVGLLTSYYLGAPRDESAQREGLQLLLNTQPGKGGNNCYYVYYAAQALHQIAGRDAEQWNGSLRAALTQAQTSGDTCCAGSWSPVGDMWGQAGGRLMVTSFSCLSLQVGYRYPRVDAPRRVPASKSAAAPPQSGQPVSDTAVAKPDVAAEPATEQTIGKR